MKSSAPRKDHERRLQRALKDLIDMARGKVRASSNIDLLVIMPFFRHILKEGKVVYESD